MLCEHCDESGISDDMVTVCYDDPDGDYHEWNLHEYCKHDFLLWYELGECDLCDEPVGGPDVTGNHISCEKDMRK